MAFFPLASSTLTSKASVPEKSLKSKAVLSARIPPQGTNLSTTHSRYISVSSQPASLATFVTSALLTLPSTRWEVLWRGTRSEHTPLWSAPHWLLPQHTQAFLSPTVVALEHFCVVLLAKVDLYPFIYPNSMEQMHPLTVFNEAGACLTCQLFTIWRQCGKKKATL